MASSTIKTRIQLKNDTEANWDKAINFVPLKGEVIIYSADDTHPFSRLKVGDGVTTVSNLPFIKASSIDEINIEFGTYEEWQNRSSYIPKKDSILIYTDKSIIDENTTIAGIKIGDGKAYGIDLPFIGDDIANDLMQHIDNQIVHITSTERNRWNHKITCDDTVVEGNLILTRN